MEPVFAYLDAGSGSLIIQAVIAGLVALPIFFRNQVRRVAGGIRRAAGRDRGTSQPRS